jgi:hypothetical protein
VRTSFNVLLCIFSMFMVICSAKTDVLTAVHMNDVVLWDVTVDGVGTSVSKGYWFLYPVLHRLTS